MNCRRCTYLGAYSISDRLSMFRKKRMISGLSLVSMDWIISFDFGVSPDEFPPP